MASKDRKLRLILDKPEDWDAWLSYIRSSVNNDKIWKLVNPDLSTQPARFPEPTEPARPIYAQGGTLDSVKIEHYKALLLFYNQDLQRWKDEEKALRTVNTLIHETISARMINQTAYSGTDPWSKLVALKQRLKPTKKAQSFDVEKRFHRLAKGPTDQKIDSWLDEWTDMYHEAIRINIPEVSGDRAVRDFLIAVETVDRVYANGREQMRDELDDRNEGLEVKLRQRTMDEEIEKFRSHYRIHQSLTSKNNSTFTTEVKPSLKGKDQEGNQSKKKDKKDIPKPTCICGEKMWYSECPYLNSTAAPSGWKPDSEVKKKVDDALKNPKIKERVTNSIERNKKITSNKSASTPPATERPEAMTTAFYSSLKATGLQSFLIHDGGSNVHVCNSYSKHLFTKLRDAQHDEFLSGGSSGTKIECWGEINTAFDSPNGRKPVVLRNVAYVGSYLTSIVSGIVLGQKNINLNSKGPHLFNDDPHQIKFQLYEVREKYTFTPTGIPYPDPSASSNSAAAVETAVTTNVVQEKPAEDWHRIMAHPSGEVISHLQDSTTGIKVTDSSVPKTNECETCALTKSHQIVSRSDHKSEDSSDPFYRISVDLMQFDASYNGHEWMTHLACMQTDFNILRTHRSKSGCTEFIIDSIHLIKKRFKRDVVIIRSDVESSFSNVFRDRLKSMGITLEESAPYTPAQNGHAERKGRMLVTKARALRIEANLPHDLWVEAIQTACYLANRTPTAKHSWKTPYELVTGNKPVLSHLKVYGCKAYVLKHLIPKKQKLEPRAHIGYLSGYDSTNIFRIWIPSQHKVVRSRDVLFDEGQVYSLADPPDTMHFLSTEGIAQESPYEITEAMRNALSDLDAEDQELQSFDDLLDNTLHATPPLQTSDETAESPTAETPPLSDFLPTPSPTPTPRAMEEEEERDSNTHRRRQEEDLGLRRTEEETSGLPSITKRPPGPRTSANTAPKASKISADVDTKNVLPEGEKRQRKSTRHDAHATLLSEAGQGSTESFQKAFSSFAASKIYRAISAFSTSQSSKTRPSVRAHRDNMPPEPKSYREFLSHPYNHFLMSAMLIEIKELQGKGTWKEVSEDEAIHANKTPIATMWVYRYKFDEDGWLVKFKARLVARGDQQQTSMDTFAATLAARLFRFLMALVAAFGLETRQYDAVNAFANAQIDEPTYCKLPPAWPGRLNILLRLIRALYGLKQSPALWHKHLSAKLIELGLEPLPGVDCIFVNTHMIIFFFVDDICAIYDKSNESYVDIFETQLFQAYEMKALGEINWFLGIRVTRNRETRQLWLSQDSYIDKIAAKFNIKANGKESPLPVENIQKFEGKASPQDVLQFQQKIGSVNFAAVITRADVANAMSKLSEHLTNPSNRHIELADGVISYLIETRDYSIQFDGNITVPREVLLVSSDASFADDLHTRYSSQGYAFKLFGGLIDWKANKQKTVTLSSTEAELLAISQTGKEALWWSRLFSMLEFDPGQQMSIQCDNQQTIRALSSDHPRFTTKMRHVDIHSHWLRQEIARKAISIHYVQSAKILADGFTKALPIQRHKEFISLLGLVRKSWPISTHKSSI